MTYFLRKQNGTKEKIKTRYPKSLMEGGEFYYEYIY